MLLLAACASSPADSAPPATADTDIETIGGSELDGVDEEGCPALYAQDRFPRFEVEIADEEWEQLGFAYTHWSDVYALGGDPKSWHPLQSFRYGDETLTDASIRLKGNPCCSWYGDKMQFVIGFAVQDEDARWHGLRKIELDAPPYDPSVLRERLSLRFNRLAGIPASCANSAELWVNGGLYGVYVNIEVPDKELLGRLFGDDDEGNLYKFDWMQQAWEVEANDGDGDEFTDLTALYESSSLTELESAYQLDGVIREWAGEAIEPDYDGYWDGSINFLLYHHPDGWLVLPWDHDYAYASDALHDPLERADQYGLTTPLDVVLADPDGEARFVAALADLLPVYEASDVRGTVTTWEAQIGAAVVAEPHRYFSEEEHLADVELLEGYAEERATWLEEWFAER